MSNKDSQKPITAQELTEELTDSTDKVILPAVEKIVEKSEIKILKSNSRVLGSNEKIVKEIKNMREEQAAMHGNYGRVYEKVENHEDYLVKADKKLNIGFERA